MESTSQKIIEAMKRKGVTLERLEAVSGVSERHIMAIVEGSKKNLPAAPYLRGYLIKIGKIIDLDGEELWKGFAKEGEAIRQSGAHDKFPENTQPRKKGNMKIAAIGAGAVFVAGLVALQLFRADNPKIRFGNLDEEVTQTKERIFIIRGNSNPGFKLTLGEEEIVVREGGAFEKEVVLEPGFNTFIFTAKKPLGKEHKFPKQIFYEETEEEKTQGEILNEMPAPSNIITPIIPEIAPKAPEVIQ